jgi:hypothetical protein
MKLQQLIDRLKLSDPNIILKNGFDRPHSYRGYYECLAFEPCQNVSVGSMLECAVASIDDYFCGWKGGEYLMTGDTDVYLAAIGSTGVAIDPEMLENMLLSGEKERFR